jgi:protein-S-isoprenylcysteine O-methyltransferase Ste14
MALTEAERKLLEELEATLTAQDPKLASKLSASHRRVHPTHAVAGVVGLLVGLVALILGMSLDWWISVIGFVIMLASAVVLVSSWQKIPGDSGQSSPSMAKGEDFLTRLEKRWRERLEQP